MKLKELRATEEDHRNCLGYGYESFFLADPTKEIVLVGVSVRFCFFISYALPFDVLRRGSDWLKAIVVWSFYGKNVLKKEGFTENIRTNIGLSEENNLLEIKGF
ncbi:hypothetical protein [Arenibacter nanhaiticus]|nr:hypothetical protein [Arenibacter nanhaiticus]